MKNQSADNHAQYVPGFHFIILPIVLVSLFMAIYMLVSNGPTAQTIWGVLTSLGLAGSSFYHRVFATANQDRIIRAEENFRCYRLTGRELDSQLSKSQIIALRFASDDEYVALMEKGIRNKLDSKQIKQTVSNWKADHHRV